jgi:hydroxymethylpyrimidine/phosphomethylpyrimidine kinase
MADPARPARLLVIAGSDSSAGAGLQADLKTAQVFHIYAQTVVTAVTVQNTEGVRDVHAVPPAIVAGQIAAALGDIGADAIKIGMLGNGGIAQAVADALTQTDQPLVLDPVLRATSGAALLDETGLNILKTRLLPRALLLTPNLPETEILTGIWPRQDADFHAAARVLAALGARAVLFKGGHATSEDSVRDVLVEDGTVTVFEAPRQHSRHTHGTGCVLSTAIACGLACNAQDLKAAVRDGHAFVQRAILTAPGLGRGQGPVNPA